MKIDNNTQTNEMATKADLANTQVMLRNEIQETAQVLRSEMQDIKLELKTEMRQMKDEIIAEVSHLLSEVVSVISAGVQALQKDVKDIKQDLSGIHAEIKILNSKDAYCRTVTAELRNGQRLLDRRVDILEGKPLKVTRH